MKNSVVLVLAVIILAFTGVCGVAIWAASRFDGGRPGITAPADGHREDDEPAGAPADRTMPPADEESGEGEDEEAVGLDAAEPRSAPAADPAEGPGGADGARGGAQTDRGSDRIPTVVWTGVRFPMECHGMPFEIRDARPLTPDSRAYVVVVRCGAGSGTAPDAIYTYDIPEDGAPVLASTLMGVGDNHLVKSVEVHGGNVHATLLGWTTEDIPRCCPDVEEVRVYVP